MPSSTQDASGRWVVVTGDVAQGLTFRGPFRTRADAEAFRFDWEVNGGEATVAKLHPPAHPEVS